MFLSFEDKALRTSYKQYHLPTLEIKNCNVMIDRQNFFDQPVRKNLITYNSIWNIATGQRDNYTTGCLLDYNYFKNLFKMIATDLSKQQALDIDEKAIKQNNFTGNLAWSPIANTTMFFITEEAKETVFVFLQGTVKVF